MVHGTLRNAAVVALFILAGALFGAGHLSAGRADSPPFPDFFWPYGRVQVNAVNISPDVQPVVAVVNGHNCGAGSTKTAVADPGNPVEDTGKTVYVIDVAGDGGSATQKAGCGRVGDLVMLYFPAMHRLALQTPSFQVGGQRVNIDLASPLIFRRMALLVSSDGTP